MVEREIWIIIEEDRGCGPTLARGYIRKEDAEKDLGSNEYIDSVFVVFDENFLKGLLK